ncbi:hypothetical protein [Sulfolobus monocaudavirus SMV3]|uniref:hypothetical protein n=1 Tax=Sulfolobus monocaudavirus SMV3 TaxID=1732177 RepID=UPI000705E335|nr:hypothetical protein AXI69_gp36 [Sulfolobus monocaudavirus SMV3]ALG96973.1 hypothetical protein [Sulfolobus monocaudavirus SMV3]
MSQEFSNDEEGESIFRYSNKSLLKLDWDVVDKLIESFLNEHMRTWSEYNYFIIDDDTLLIKVYEAQGEVEPAFTVKARLEGDRLVVVEVR